MSDTAPNKTKNPKAARILYSLLSGGSAVALMLNAGLATSSASLASAAIGYGSLCAAFGLVAYKGGIENLSGKFKIAAHVGFVAGFAAMGVHEYLHGDTFLATMAGASAALSVCLALKPPKP